MQNILADQLTRSRDGDRFWYENDQFSAEELAEIKATTMHDVLSRNFDLSGVPEEAFRPMTFDRWHSPEYGPSDQDHRACRRRQD